MSVLLQEYEQLAIKSTGDLVRDAQTKARSTKTAVNRCGKRIESLFGIEEDARAPLVNQLSTLRTEHTYADTRHKIMKKGCAQLSMEPLSWRREEDGWPKLALFSLNEPTFCLAVETERKNQVSARSIETGRLADTPMAAYFEDVLDILEEQIIAKSGSNRITLSTRYTGMVPDATRAKIVAMKKAMLFERIYIIAEAQTWEVNEVPVIKPACPLVVGFDGRELWLFDRYDTTPTEEYIAREFATG